MTNINRRIEKAKEKIELTKQQIQETYIITRMTNSIIHAQTKDKKTEYLFIKQNEIYSKAATYEKNK